MFFIAARFKKREKQQNKITWPFSSAVMSFQKKVKKRHKLNKYKLNKNFFIRRMFTILPTIKNRHFYLLTGLLNKTYSRL